MRIPLASPLRMGGDPPRNPPPISDPLGADAAAGPGGSRSSELSAPQMAAGGAAEQGAAPGAHRGATLPVPSCHPKPPLSPPPSPYSSNSSPPFAPTLCSPSPSPLSFYSPFAPPFPLSFYSPFAPPFILLSPPAPPLIPAPLSPLQIWLQLAQTISGPLEEAAAAAFSQVFGLKMWGFGAGETKTGIFAAQSCDLGPQRGIWL